MSKSTPRVRLDTKSGSSLLKRRRPDFWSMDFSQIAADFRVGRGLTLRHQGAKEPGKILEVRKEKQRYFASLQYSPLLPPPSPLCLQKLRTEGEILRKVPPWCLLALASQEPEEPFWLENTTQTPTKHPWTPLLSLQIHWTKGEPTGIPVWGVI
jgi:hypothetical protein